MSLPLNLPTAFKSCHAHAVSTISTLLHDKINPKDCQVLSLGDSGFLQIFRVVSSDYGKPSHRIFQSHILVSHLKETEAAPGVDLK